MNRYEALRLAIQWAEDILRGEFITTRTYQKTHLSFPPFIKDADLRWVSQKMNDIYLPHRAFTYEAGELLSISRLKHRKGAQRNDR